MQFEYYVLNYDFNKEEVEMYNIFNNSIVQEWSEKEIKKYLRAPSRYKKVDYSYDWNDGCMNTHTIYGFEALCDQIRSILMNQLWSRIQYEISVGDVFIPDIKHTAAFIDACIKEGKTIEELKSAIDKENKKRNHLTKIDCYYQCLPNLENIVHTIIRQYKEQLKKQKAGGSVND